MFDKIYVEKKLYDRNVVFFENLADNCKVRILYLKTDENRECETEIKSLYIGLTKVFLDCYTNNNAVIAVLNSEEDLFSFKYAVEDVESIDYDYLNFIYCRFYKIQLEVFDTERCVVKEMDYNSAKYFFSLVKKYPDFFEDAGADFFTENNIENKAAAYIENVYDFYGYGTWAVYEKNTGSLVGFVGINNCPADEKNVLAISYYIEEKFRNKGFATETANAAIDYVRREYGVKDVYCFVSEVNEPSLNTAKKLDVTCVVIHDAPNNIKHFLFEYA